MQFQFSKLSWIALGNKTPHCRVLKTLFANNKIWVMQLINHQKSPAITLQKNTHRAKTTLLALCLLPPTWCLLLKKKRCFVGPSHMFGSGRKTSLPPYGVSWSPDTVCSHSCTQKYRLDWAIPRQVKGLNIITLIGAFSSNIIIVSCFINSRHWRHCISSDSDKVVFIGGVLRNPWKTKNYPSAEKGFQFHYKP